MDEFPEIIKYPDYEFSLDGVIKKEKELFVKQLKN